MHMRRGPLLPVSSASRAPGRAHVGKGEQSDLVSVAGAIFLILTSLWVFWCFLKTKSPVYGVLPRPTREVSSRSPLPTPQIPQTPPPAPAVSKEEELAQTSSSRIERLIHETGCTTKFFLAWTTSVESFTLRYRRTIESTLKHHPDACVIVYSPTLPQDHFSRFTQLGYRIIVERPDVAALLQGTPAQPWYEQADKWRNGPYFFSHITEIIRLATLYKYGGVYLDTDVIVMRPLSELRNCVGTELHGPRGEAQVLNGAVLIFDQGSPFIWECMLEHNRTYRIDSWGWNGPELVTRVAGRFPTGPGLNILPTTAFYPIHWGQIQQFFGTDDLGHQRDVWQRLSQQTFLFHYWNKVTKDLVPQPSSLMYKVFNNFCIFCADSGADG